MVVYAVAAWNRWGCNPQGGGQGFVLWPFQGALVRLFSCRCVVCAVAVGMAALSKEWLMQAACHLQQLVAADVAANVRPFKSVDLRT